MRKTIVITDVTRMREDRVCIAGIDNAGKCVRPVLRNNVLESHLYLNGDLVILPRSKVQFEFKATSVVPPHIEDEIFEESAVVHRGMCSDGQWRALLEESSFSSVNDVFDNKLTEGRYVTPGTETRSLGTVGCIAIERVQIISYGANRRYVVDFTDGKGRSYSNFPCSDLTFRLYCDELVNDAGNEFEASQYLSNNIMGTERVYLRIGLSRPYQPPGQPRGCWRQITGLYTFPDYLNGTNLTWLLK